jgi:putative transposase
MNPAESLKHTKWECKYHVVWMPKYRKKSLYQGLRRYLGELLKDLAAQKECKILEGFGVGSCAYSDFNPAQILGVTGGRLH